MLHLAHWTEWEDTSLCSKSCGTGKKNQKRYCKRGDKKVDYSECDGDIRETFKANCNPQRCRKFKLYHIIWM